jgi:hypothetical protein
MVYSRLLDGVRQVLKPPEVTGNRRQRPARRPHQQPQRRRCSRGGAGAGAAAAAVAHGGHCAAGGAAARTRGRPLRASGAQAIDLCVQFVPHFPAVARRGPGARPPVEPISEKDRFKKLHCGRCMKPLSESAHNSKEVNEGATYWVCSVCVKKLQARGGQDSNSVWDCPTARDGDQGGACCTKAKEAAPRSGTRGATRASHRPRSKSGRMRRGTPLFCICALQPLHPSFFALP